MRFGVTARPTECEAEQKSCRLSAEDDGVEDGEEVFSAVIPFRQQPSSVPERQSHSWRVSGELLQRSVVTYQLDQGCPRGQKGSS